ncbi:MAG TPA: hypothetical protein VL426_01655 [Candidatus Binatia bacterium]|nr:hypothetical protein [Candidatus Binatia bacterium]
MKTSNLSVLCAILMTVTVGCGLQEGGDTTPPPDCTSNCGDGGSGPTGDGGTVTPPADGGGSYIPAPVVSPAACLLEFADDYISGSPCGDVVGTLPGMTWTAGPRISDSNSDGRLEYHPASIPAGTYDLSYRDRGCANEVDRTNWALYGDPEMLRAMSPDARSFITCNWWVNGAIVQVTDPGCHLKISVDAACAITGAGNMRDFH